MELIRSILFEAYSPSSGSRVSQVSSLLQLALSSTCPRTISSSLNAARSIINGVSSADGGDSPPANASEYERLIAEALPTLISSSE
jgi:hypothetical protein